MPDAADADETGLEEPEPVPGLVEGVDGVLVGTSPFGDRLQSESLPPAPQN